MGRVLNWDGELMAYTRTWAQLAQTVCAERKYQHLSQEDLAKLAGVSLLVVQDAEKALPVLSEHSTKLLKVLKISGAYIPYDADLERKYFKGEDS